MTDIAMSMAREEIRELRAEVERLTNDIATECDAWAKDCAKLEQLMQAIRSTASEGTYDEIAIRKAVSFELAELIRKKPQRVECEPPSENGPATSQH